jgi:hypothetical protein
VYTYIKVLNRDIQLAAVLCLPGRSTNYNFINSHSTKKSPCKLTVAQRLKCPYFYGTRRLITINGDLFFRFAPYGIGGVADVSGEFYASLFWVEVIRDKMLGSIGGLSPGPTGGGKELVPGPANSSVEEGI